MSIDIHYATDTHLERWDDHVEQSPQGTVFHRREALDVLAEHSGTTVHHLVGLKGQEPVGVFPVFEKGIGPVSTAFSPPPGLRVPYLGPAMLNMTKLSRRKTDRRHKQFVDGCLEWIDDELHPRYGHIRTNGRHDDLRPFAWNGCDVTPEHTYVVDLDRDEADLLASFSSDARRNVQPDGEEDFDVRVGGVEAIRSIVEQVAARYASQGVEFGVDVAFVTDLHDRLPDGQVRPYVLEVGGEFQGGILALEDGDTAYRWQGGVRTDAETDLRVNDLLDWHVMRDAMDRGCTAYDLVGAETPRINTYKAKWDPDLRTCHRIELGSPLATGLAHLYQSVK